MLMVDLSKLPSLIRSISDIRTHENCYLEIKFFLTGDR